MKKQIKNHLNTYQNIYLLTIIVFLSGILFGIYMNVYQNIEDNGLLNTLSNEAVLNKEFHITNLIANITMILALFLLGFSLIGTPFICFIIFTKGMQIGFSCALFISTFQLKGILGIILTIIPQIFFEIIAVFIMGVIAIQVTNLLISRVFFDNKIISFKQLMNYYLNYLIYSLILIFISTVFKIYVAGYFMKLFNML